MWCKVTPFSRIQFTWQLIVSVHPADAVLWFKSGSPRFDPYQHQFFLIFHIFVVVLFQIFLFLNNFTLTAASFLLFGLVKFSRISNPLRKFFPAPNFSYNFMTWKCSTALKFLYCFSDFENFLQYLIIHIIIFPT